MGHFKINVKLQMLILELVPPAVYEVSWEEVVKKVRWKKYLLVCE